MEIQKSLSGIFVTVLVLVLAFEASAQNEAFSSHYMLNPATYNAGWIGTEEVANAAFQIRSQWTGYTTSFDGKGGAPLTQYFTGSIPIRSTISAVGLSVINDAIGPISQLQAMVPIVYSLETRRGQVSFGLAPGVYSVTQKFDELRFNDPTDVLNIGTRETQTRPNLNFGVVYHTLQDFFLGVSINNLFEPTFNFGLDSLSNKKSRYYALVSGFERRLTRDLSIRPSVGVRSSLSTTTFDVSLLLTVMDRAWGGLSYRYEEAVVFMVGYSFLQDNRLQVGYAMDYIVDESNAKQTTSQEIFIRLNMPDLVIGGKKQVKTPRFTH